MDTISTIIMGMDTITMVTTIIAAIMEELGWR